MLVVVYILFHNPLNILHVFKILNLSLTLFCISLWIFSTSWYLLDVMHISSSQKHPSSPRILLGVWILPMTWFFLFLLQAFQPLSRSYSFQDYKSPFESFLFSCSTSNQVQDLYLIYHPDTSAFVSFYFKDARKSEFYISRVVWDPVTY